jgi:hypothetical protein
VTADTFYARWAAKLPPADRTTFLQECALLISVEQARERRRLATDRAYYRRSVDEVLAEIRRQVPR